MDGRLYVFVGVGINGSIEKSISVATRPEFQEPLLRLNTTLIGRPGLHWCTIKTVKSDISWPRSA